jgi:predicted nucleic acid-binding protein
MTERTFVDTNVWVYAVDEADPAKHARALALLTPSPESDLVVSTQVLMEF